MLSCRDVYHSASDYLDKELPWQRRMQVKIHLLICVHCRRLVSHLQLLITRLRKRPLPQPDPEFVEQLVDRLDDANAR